MGIYPNEQDIFSKLSGVGFFVGTFMANIMSAAIVEKCGDNVMTTPLIAVFKAIIDIPLLGMIYLQQDSFKLAMAGILGEFLFAKGWTSPVLLMLQTVVDPSIKGITTAMFLFT